MDIHCTQIAQTTTVAQMHVYNDKIILLLR